MPAFLDARKVEAGTELTPDLAIIGGGPAGISLALALAGARFRVLLLESGGMEFEAATQKLYDGSRDWASPISRSMPRACAIWAARPIIGAAGAGRSTPTISRSATWVAHSGWPFGAQANWSPITRARRSWSRPGPSSMTSLPAIRAGAWAGWCRWAPGGVYTSFFQFSQWAGNPQHLPTHFGERYAADLKAVPNLQVMLHANVTGLRLANDAKTLEHLDVATLSGRRFTRAPAPHGAGGGRDRDRAAAARLRRRDDDRRRQRQRSGRPLLRRSCDPARHRHARDSSAARSRPITGPISPPRAPISAPRFSPTEAFKRQRHVLGSLATVEQHVKLDALGQAAVTETAAALGVDARAMPRPIRWAAASS